VSAPVLSLDSARLRLRPMATLAALDACIADLESSLSTTRGRLRLYDRPLHQAPRALWVELAELERQALRYQQKRVALLDAIEKAKAKAKEEESRG
jgi:hypothetical protein